MTTKEDRVLVEGIVARLCERAKVRMPKIVVGSQLPRLAYTDSIIERAIYVHRDLISSVSREELEGVLAHEVGHLKVHHAWMRFFWVWITTAIALFSTGWLFFSAPLIGALMTFSVGAWFFYRKVIIPAQESAADIWSIRLSGHTGILRWVWRHNSTSAKNRAKAIEKCLNDQKS
jgi:Zn-dependent protease with chaperone function